MGERERERERAEKYDAGDGISHCKVFQATATEDDRKDDREEDTDARRKGNGRERGKRFRLTGGCFGPLSVLVRFLSIRRPVAAAPTTMTEREAHTRGERGDAREWSRGMTRESDGRDSCDEKGVYRRELRSITQDGTTTGMRKREIERKRERKRKSRGMKKERENGGSHTGGRMTGLLRRGEESGGYDRRRVQIITIIIFPGNMAAERGWPPGRLVYA